jgi:uroporphyrin-III C-methyltransferase / precorrin-2 dehydrogenase / sirohydrochlorin ferrochelatase
MSDLNPKIINITSAPKAKVYLVGTGPGDPELITVKAINCIKKADVILVDRLVSNDILDLYAPKNVEIIEVGKQCKQANSTPQEYINELILDYAKQNLTVVRLKGGDVSIFSNILDELNTCVSNNIDYEIIPGVTAATGAAAYAGIPLTARQHAVAVRFLTFYKPEIVNDHYWQELAITKDTLVFYMSADTLDQVVDKLVQFGVRQDVHIAVVEQATTPMQKVHTCNIYEFDKIKDVKFASPSIIIVGKVVTLHEQFKWKENSESNELYFKPVIKLDKNIKASN